MLAVCTTSVPVSRGRSRRLTGRGADHCSQSLSPSWSGAGNENCTTRWPSLNVIFSYLIPPCRISPAASRSMGQFSRFEDQRRMSFRSWSTQVKNTEQQNKQFMGNPQHVHSRGGMVASGGCLRANQKHSCDEEPHTRLTTDSRSSYISQTTALPDLIVKTESVAVLRKYLIPQYGLGTGLRRHKQRRLSKGLEI